MISLIPAGWIRRPQVPGSFDHALAYFLAAALLVLAYRKPRQRFMIALSLSGIAVLLEVAQGFLDSRHAMLRDALAGIGGTVAGCVCAAVVSWLAVHRSTTRGACRERSAHTNPNPAVRKGVSP